MMDKLIKMTCVALMGFVLSLPVHAATSAKKAEAGLKKQAAKADMTQEQTQEMVKIMQGLIAGGIAPENAQNALKTMMQKKLELKQMEKLSQAYQNAHKNGVSSSCCLKLMKAGLEAGLSGKDTAEILGHLQSALKEGQQVKNASAIAGHIAKNHGTPDDVKGALEKHQQLMQEGLTERESRRVVLQIHNEKVARKNSKKLNNGEKNMKGESSKQGEDAGGDRAKKQKAKLSPEIEAILEQKRSGSEFERNRQDQTQKQQRGETRSESGDSQDTTGGRKQRLKNR
ncbi:hypothetical protein ACFL6Y_02925 [Elusimicrobiota bacterium]